MEELPSGDMYQGLAHAIDVYCFEVSCKRSIILVTLALGSTPIITDGVE